MYIKFPLTLSSLPANFICVFNDRQNKNKTFVQFLNLKGEICDCAVVADGNCSPNSFAIYITCTNDRLRFLIACLFPFDFRLLGPQLHESQLLPFAWLPVLLFFQESDQQPKSSGLLRWNNIDVCVIMKNKAALDDSKRLSLSTWHYIFCTFKSNAFRLGSFSVVTPQVHRELSKPWWNYACTRARLCWPLL